MYLLMDGEIDDPHEYFNEAGLNRLHTFFCKIQDYILDNMNYK